MDPARRVWVADSGVIVAGTAVSEIAFRDRDTITNMARIWIEPYNAQSGPPIEYWGRTDSAAHYRAPTLVPMNVLFVNVASFTFRFFCEQQVRDCLDYYEKRTHPSSRLAIGSADHWEAQRWFERLPMFLLEEPKRLKVVKALRQALATAEAGVFVRPASQ